MHMLLFGKKEATLNALVETRRYDIFITFRLIISFFFIILFDCWNDWEFSSFNRIPVCIFLFVYTVFVFRNWNPNCTYQGDEYQLSGFINTTYITPYTSLFSRITSENDIYIGSRSATTRSTRRISIFHGSILARIRRIKWRLSFYVSCLTGKSRLISTASRRKLWWMRGVYTYVSNVRARVSKYREVRTSKTPDGWCCIR